MAQAASPEPLSASARTCYWPQLMNDARAQERDPRKLRHSSPEVRCNTEETFEPSVAPLLWSAAQKQKTVQMCMRSKTFKCSYT